MHNRIYYALFMMCVVIAAFLGSQDVGAVVTAGEETSEANASLDECVRFLSGYDAVDNPEAVCEKIFLEKESCTKILEDYGVKYAERRCESIISTKAVRAMDRAQLRDDVKEQFSEANKTALRLRACSYYVGKHTDIENPAYACKQVFSDVESCSETLEEQGIEDAAEKCERIHEFKDATLAEIRSAKGASKAEAAERRVDELKERIRDRRQEAAERQVEKKVRERARQAYMNAKGRIKVHREKFTDARGQLQAVKAQLARCHNDSSETCEEVRERAVNVTKDYLINSLELLKNHLELRKSSIEGADGITDEQAEELMALIDDSIEEIDLMIAKIEEVQTPEEMNELKGDVIELIRKHKVVAEMQGYRIVHMGINKIITQLEVTQERLSCSIEGMIEDGLNGTDELMEMLSEYESLIDQAKGEQEETVDIIIGMLSGDAENMTWGERRSTIARSTKDVKDTLSQAHKLMRDIVRDIHREGGEICQVDEEGQDDGTGDDSDDSDGNQEDDTPGSDDGDDSPDEDDASGDGDETGSGSDDTDGEGKTKKVDDGSPDQSDDSEMSDDGSMTGNLTPETMG